MKTRHYLLISVALFAVAVVAGCGTRNQAEADAKTATQIAAKVDPEVTVHQVNFVLARNPNG